MGESKCGKGSEEVVIQHCSDKCEWNSLKSHLAEAKDHSLASAAVRSAMVGRTIPTIRMIYLVPRDRQHVAAFELGMSRAIVDLQRWFFDQMADGSTFTLHQPIVEVFGTQHDAAWYANNPSGPFSFWNNVVADGFSLTSGGFDDPLNRWIYYIDAQNNPGTNGGGGANGVAVLPRDDLLGLIGQGSGSICRWIGGLGHELGHALGLPHPTQCENGSLPQSHPTCQSLMYLGYLIYPNTTLLPSDRAALTASGFFAKTTPPQASDCSQFNSMA